MGERKSGTAAALGGKTVRALIIGLIMDVILVTVFYVVLRAFDAPTWGAVGFGAILWFVLKSSAWGRMAAER